MQNSINIRIINVNINMKIFICMFTKLLFFRLFMQFLNFYGIECTSATLEIDPVD